MILKQKGRWIYFATPIPKNLQTTVRNKLHYVKQGAEFMPNPMWANVYFFRKRTNSFPTGLFYLVKPILDSWCKIYGIEWTIKYDNFIIATPHTHSEKLRQYQKDAIIKLNRNGGGIIHLPTGSGKTFACVEYLNQFSKDYKALVVVPTLDLKGQWEKENIVPKTDVKTYQSIKDLEMLVKYNIVVFDECLTGGTKIDTENGSMRIKDIVENEYSGKVLSFNHNTNKHEFKKIKSYLKSRKRATYNITIRNKNTGKKKILRSTENHKWYINGNYKKTDDISIGDILLQRNYICPFCDFETTNSKTIGGHININHLHKNQDRSADIQERIGRTVSENIINGKTPNSFLKVGNGRGMSGLEKYVYNVLLSKDWKYNFVIKTGTIGNGIPSYYKIDFYNMEKGICLEVDGKHIHCSKKQKVLDKKKDRICLSLGYRIIRLSEITAYNIKTREAFETWMNGKL